MILHFLYNAHHIARPNENYVYVYYTKFIGAPHVILLIIIHFLPFQRYYINAARELQRLIGVCRAPVMQHFAESITGSNIIRCFNKEGQFISSTGHLMDNFSRPCLYNAAALEWLSLRLDILSLFIFGFSLILLVSFPTDLIDPSK